MVCKTASKKFKPRHSGGTTLLPTRQPATLSPGSPRSSKSDSSSDSKDKNKKTKKNKNKTKTKTDNKNNKNNKNNKKSGGKKSKRKRSSTKKIQKGGLCRQNEICLFIKSHSSSNRQNFIVPQNMTINFYTPKGHTAPASYNDIRDVCYDIDLHADQLCDQYNTGQRCPDYKLTPFGKDPPDIHYYAAKEAGLYECPLTFYPNNQFEAGPPPKLINGIVGETTLSTIIKWIEQTRQPGDNRHIQVNCNFCRGTTPTTSNKFFNSIVSRGNRFSDEYNQQLRQHFDTNMGVGMMDTS